ncbi:MAG: hypothetical protein JSS44_08115 [Proteobacteria bacterium]|nr:hypothetical protein [Pseudomonadota bacterium]
MILNLFVKKLSNAIPINTWFLSKRPSVIFHPLWHGFGEIEVLDEDDELLVNFGNFTHGHFSCHNEKLSPEERENRIADNLIEFLQDVFADRVEFYGSLKGGGGYRYLDAKSTPHCANFYAKTYLWSGIKSKQGHPKNPVP